MSNTFTDLKQLSRTLLKKSPPPRVDPVPDEKPVVDDGAEVLAYFSRPSRNAHGNPRVASEVKPLERLGLRLISGRNHRKLQYANVRVTLAKTPSDYRANLNSGSEIANRCF